jgi:hypothetical protein
MKRPARHDRVKEIVCGLVAKFDGCPIGLLACRWGGQIAGRTFDLSHEGWVQHSPNGNIQAAFGLRPTLKAALTIAEQEDPTGTLGVGCDDGQGRCAQRNDMPSAIFCALCWQVDLLFPVGIDLMCLQVADLRSALKCKDQ